MSTPATRGSTTCGSRVGPRIVPVGPLLDGAGAAWSHQRVVSGPEEGREVVRRLKANSVAFVKVYALLSAESFFAITAESKRQRLVVTGHLPRTVTAAEASDAGQQTIEHASSLFVGTSSREEEFRNRAAAGDAIQREEIIGAFDAEKAQRLYAKLKTNATAVVPTLSPAASNAAVAAREPEDSNRLVYVPRAYLAAWRNAPPGPAGRLKAALHHAEMIVRQLHQAGVEVLPGTDVVKASSSPGSPCMTKLALLVGAGMSKMEVLQAATMRAARLAGETRAGTIQVGKAADLVLLDANPLVQIRNTRTIGGVVAAGRFFDTSALRAMLDDISRAAAAWNGTPTGRWA